MVHVGGDDAALLMPDGREHGIRLGLEGVQEVGVAVAHHAEDGVDVAGEGEGDVSGHGGHARAFRDRDGGF